MATPLGASAPNPYSSLQELSGRAREEGRSYAKKRWIFPKIEGYLEGRIYIALVGPRGAGKSVLLKQSHAQSAGSFYISLDTFVPSPDLFSLAKDLLDRNVRILLLDEIHNYPHWGSELKKIYDFLPELKIVFTSSSAISLHDATYDLSRRVRLVFIHPFSFGEYLYFLSGEEHPPLTWGDLLNVGGSRQFYGKNIHTESYFADFLKGGNYPFAYKEKDSIPLFRHMLDTIISEDLVRPSRITLEESYEVRKMLSFIGRSSVDGISYSSIARNSGISKYKAQKYVDLLEKGFVLARVPPKGTNVSKEPKILFSPPYRLLYRSYEECIGFLREDFFVDAAKRLEPELFFLKGGEGEKTPDYLLGGVVFEIGGRNKGRSQFKGFSAKKKIIFTQPGTLDEMRRPLFFAGMLKEK